MSDIDAASDQMEIDFDFVDAEISKYKQMVFVAF
jgi:hypothetical protein